MPFCEECGAKIESNATFCEKCHHSVSKNNLVENQTTGSTDTSSDIQSDPKKKSNSLYKYLGIALLLISGLLIILTILNSGSNGGGLKETRQITTDIMILLLIGVGGWYFYSKGQPKKTRVPMKIQEGKSPIIESSNHEKNEPLQEIQEEKNPILAAVCSLVIPGLGQVYNGETIRGVAILLGTVIGYYIFVIPGLIVWVFGMYDAYTMAQKMNYGELPLKATNVTYMILFVILALLTIAISFVIIFALYSFGAIPPPN